MTITLTKTTFQLQPLQGSVIITGVKCMNHQ